MDGARVVGNLSGEGAGVYLEIMRSNLRCTYILGLQGLVEIALHGVLFQKKRD